MMSNLRKRLSHTKIGYGMGFRFTGDNKVTAVFRHGEFNRVEKGFFRIHPIYETITDPIPCTMRTGVYKVPLLTNDNFTILWHIKVLFVFDLRDAANPSLACNFTEPILQNIVGNRLEQTLSLHVPAFKAAELNTPHARAHLARHTHQFVADNVKPAGITVMATGVSLGAIEFPEAYQRIVEEEHRLNHLKTLLAADGQLSFEDKLILAFRSAKDQNPDFNINTAATTMMMMQNMAPKNTPPVHVINGHTNGNGHA